MQYTQNQITDIWNMHLTGTARDSISGTEGLGALIIENTEYVQTMALSGEFDHAQKSAGHELQNGRNYVVVFSRVFLLNGTWSNWVQEAYET